MTRAHESALLYDTTDSTRFVLAGHSHACALGLGISSRNVKPKLATVGDAAFPTQGLIGPWPRKPNYWDALVAAARESIVFLMWAGNQHLVRFMFATGSPFDFHIAAYPELSLLPDATLVPESLVRSVFVHHTGALDDLLARLCCVPGCRPVLLGTPAPKRDGPRLRRLMFKEPHFQVLADRLGCSLDEIELTPPSVRQKLWLVVQELVSESALRARCPFVPVPPGSLDADGFLKEDYWADDVSHANARYGALFWQHLKASFGAAS